MPTTTETEWDAVALCTAHRDYQLTLGWDVGPLVVVEDGSASFRSRTVLVTYTADGRTVATSLNR